MRQFFYQKELKLKKKRLLMMVACMAVLLAGYVILTWPKKVESEAPTVIVESAEKGDVEIYGEYVGRIRAQQFVEVRARVEGYLENMLFAEGTYVTKNQVLFVINQDQYRAKADKARAQLKKDEAQALKAKRDLERIRPPLCAERCQPAGFGQCPGCLRDCRSLSSDEPGRFGPG